MKHLLTTCLFSLSIGLFSQENTNKEATTWFENILQQPVTEQEIYQKINSAKFLPSLTKTTLNTQKDAESLTKILWASYKEASTKIGKNTLITTASHNPGENSLTPQKLALSGEEMPYVLFSRGTKPEKGWPLYIATHGGGMDPGAKGKHGSSFNNREWEAQTYFSVEVYPDNAMYFVPRMPNDAHGRWWLSYSQDMYLNMIRQVVLFQNVDPDRIYFIGISEGGYATYRLAPFFADKWGACGAMAAGDLPATCPAENLKTTPFFTSVGERDTGFKRNEYAQTYHQYLTKLSNGQKTFYVNGLDLQAGRGHGIEYSIAPKWCYQHHRTAYPKEFQWINYELDHRYRPSFFWLETLTPPEQGKNISYKAKINEQKNEISLEIAEVNRNNQDAVYKPITNSSIRILLNDELIDFNKKVTVIINGKKVFDRMIKRNANMIMRSIATKGDPNQIYSAKIDAKF